MRAITQEAYGPVEVLRPAELERPTIAADEVLVQVGAATGRSSGGCVE